MRKLQYHIILALLAAGILFVLFNFMPGQSERQIGSGAAAEDGSAIQDSLTAVSAVGVGNGLGIDVGR